MTRNSHLIRLLATTCFVFAAVAAFAQPAIRNGGFEELDAKGFPAGWHLGRAGEPDHEAGGKVEAKSTAEGEAHTGKCAIEVSGEVSSFPVFVDQDLDAAGKGPLPPRGTVGFWYRIAEGKLQRAAVTVMGVKPPTRDYPGGFFIPMTFAADGQWHYARFSYDLTENYKGVESAFVRIYLMSFESTYPARVRFQVDDVQFIPGDPAWLAPRLFHIIEGADPNACELRLYVRNMGLAATTTKLKLEIPSHLKTNEPAEQAIQLAAGPTHGLHGNDTTGTGVVKWTLTGPRKPGDKLAITWQADKPEDRWTWTRELKATPKIDRLVLSKGLLANYEKATLDVLIKNEGHAEAPAGMRVDLQTTNTLKIRKDLSQALPGPIAPGQTVKLTWPIEGRMQGVAQITAKLFRSDGTTLSQGISQVWVDPAAGRLTPSADPEKRKGQALIQSGKLIFSLGNKGTGTAAQEIQNIWEGYGQSEYGMAKLYWAEGDKFVPLGSIPHLGAVRTRGMIKWLRYKPQGEITTGSASLVAKWADDENVSWTSTLELRAPDQKEEIQVTATLEAAAARKLPWFAGPCLLAGDGATSLSKTAAHLPGIEWVEANEESSNQSNIEVLSDQRVPHPNKITVPVMGVVAGGRMLGLMWDPLQKWDGSHTRPAVGFNSPTAGQANHSMGLFLPSVPDYVPSSPYPIVRPYDLQPCQKLTLRYSIIASDKADELAPIEYWYAKHGAPAPPKLDRTHEEELAMCGLKPRIDVNVIQKINSAIGAGELARKRQADNGWWPWSYGGGLVTNVLNWSHTDNFDKFGLIGDQAIGGYSPSWGERYGNVELIRLARYTGKPEIVEAAMKALRAGERFTRPEGVSPWELPLHTADILGSAFGVSFYVEGYKLTGDPHWLDVAKYWAKTGLPFVYTWAAPDQPHMLGGTIGVYGGSFMDYTLLGQVITWMGLDYAESLCRLAELDAQGLWKKVAESVINNVIMQQEKTGEHAKQWPDWRDLTKNRVLANIWYVDNPWPGRVLRVWMGGEPDPATTIVKTGGREIRVTADGEVKSAKFEAGKLMIELAPLDQPEIHVAIAGVEPIADASLTAPVARPITDVAYNKEYGIGFVSLKRNNEKTMTIEAAVAPLK